MKAKYFISGMLIMALILTAAIPAMAASTEKKISAYFNNIKIYINDVLIQPKDAAGNTIEPFIYNGTTYLPVRAVADALGVNVVWEGKKNSVYLGEHNSNVPVASLADMEWFYTNDTGGIKHTGKIKDAGLKDNIGNTYTRGMWFSKASGGSIYKVYLINQKYSSLVGTIAIEERDKNDTKGSGVKVYGDGKMLYESPLMTAGSYPEEFEIDVSGVIELKIEWYGSSESWGGPDLICADLDFYQ
jgi:hypothetical protein